MRHRAEGGLEGEERNPVLKSPMFGWIASGFHLHCQLCGTSNWRVLQTCLWLRIILSHGLPLRYSTLLTGAHVPTLGSFSYFYFSPGCQLIFLSGLIQISAQDFHQLRECGAPVS